MPGLRIFADLRLPEAAHQLLARGIGPDTLIRAARPVSSVLAKADPDPEFPTADIAFGQPDLEDIRRSPRLRWAHISSAGFTRYDTPAFREYARGRGLILTNSSSVYARACAEQVFAFMAAQSRALPEALATRTPNGSPDWLRLRAAPRSLYGSNTLLLGFGAIARELLALLAPYSMTLTAVRRQPRGDEGIPVITPDAVPAALAAADHVVNLLPDNADSRGWIDRHFFAAMKPGAVFYNIGRGTTVNQADLDTALRSGHLGAAWLDVTEPEPLPDDHPLWTAPRCHITPHVAGGHSDEGEHLVRHFLENLQRFRSGQPLHDRIL